MSNLTLFFLGVISGIVIVAVAIFLYVTYTIMRYQKELKKTEAMLNGLSSDASPKSSLKERLSRVKEITSKQLELSAIIDTPQKNALDGKYKNSLISEINELEQEKNNILSSILDDNLDPKIAILDEQGKIITMKLSEYMGRSATKRKPKLTLHLGGKNGDSGNSSLPTKEQKDGDSN